MTDHESPFRSSAAQESPFKISPVAGGFQFSFDVSAAKGERQTKRAMFDHFEMICDEGEMLGGDNSAPPPLAYFAAAIAF